MNLPLLDEIERDLDELADGDHNLARKRLDPVGSNETVLGNIDSPSARALSALGWRYTKAGVALKHDAEFGSGDEAADKALLVRARRSMVLAYVARLLAHFTAVLEVGDAACEAETDDDTHVHIRAGWQLVSHRKMNPGELLGRALKIHIPNPEDPDE